MAKSSEYRMAIKIAGEIEKSLYDCTDLTRKELNKIAREAAYASTKTKDSLSRGLKESEPFFEGMEKAGVKTFKAVVAAAAAAGTVIAGIGTVSAKAGIEFESAFAGVKKTTDATAGEYAQMKEEILAMTREIPASGAEISAVAEAAGQLGIEKENLLEFSRTMIDLGESTNLSSEEAASSLAKFANITNMSADNYGKLGSVIVDLGNNFATTEADIVSMATNMASAGELAGFTEPQIMAMATAMSSVGIDAEAGGTAMSKMIKKVQVAVETGSGSLKDYASVAGMTVEEFKKDFQKDGLTAVSAFIEGLNDVERNGKSATVILDEMGLTEARLSNTLLSLANADDLMLRAVETANEAWDENTALTDEAAKRYETTESKIAVMKNGFTEMGIAMYDQFNEPLREGIDIITDLTHEATKKISGSNVIHDLAQDIVRGIPAAVDIIEQAAEAAGNFAEPFLAVGDWLAEHPELLTGTITGVGTALATYKVASGVMSLAAALSAMGPAGWAVMGIGGAAAVITGIGTSIKKSAAEAKKANLDAHFGKISLSMQEMEDVAAYILSNDSFGQLQETISELEELDGISSSIDDTVSELNRMNWKISLGMELQEDEQEQYKQNIASYVSDVQAYLEQEQYAVSLSVGVLAGEDMENSNIVTQLNEFYAGKNAELASLGTQLNETVTAAFQDGLFDIDEAKTITDLQQQMADVKASLAMGSYEANLDLIGMKYAGGNLDAESFQNMLVEIAEQKEAAKLQYDEAYVAANQANRSMLEEGTITQEEYEANRKEMEDNYLAQVSSLDIKGNDFAIGTVRQQYGKELEGLSEWLYDETEQQLGERLDYADWSGNTASMEFLGKDIINGLEGRIDASTQDALSDLFELMKPTLEQMESLEQQYKDAGATIPEGFREGLSDMRVIGAISGDVDAMWGVIGEISESEEYQNIIKAVTEAGGVLPEAFGNSMLEGQDYINNAVQLSWQATQQIIDETYGNNTLNIPLNIQTSTSYHQGRLSDKYIGQSVDIANNADGGIITRPTVSWLAEGGYAESVIPLDGSQNAVSLWQRTGEMLGVFNRKNGFHALASQLMSDSGSSTINNSEENNKFSYSPTYNFYGDAPSKKDLDEHIEDSFEKWEEKMEQWIKNNRRFSFS